MVSAKPLNYPAIIREALMDAEDYRRNHCRRIDIERNEARAFDYEMAGHMLDEHEIAIVHSGVAELIDDNGNLLIPAIDAETVIEALFLASALRLSQGRESEAEPYRLLAAALGDDR
jgi:hypothetical protein